MNWNYAIKQKFKIFIILLIVVSISSACKRNINSRKASIIGTWKLIEGTTIQGKDSTITDYTKQQEMIKIINETHFAFLRHDLTKGKDSTAVFVAGGGKYTLNGSKYIEHLEYFNLRDWEGHNFELDYKIVGDTLITKGIEKIEKLNINYINIEKFIRVVD